MSKKEKVIKYRATDFGKKNPIVAFVGKKRVGVGGAVKATPNPPVVPFVIPEATGEQYEVLFKRGLSKWIEAYEENGEISDSSKSDTGATGH